MTFILSHFDEKNKISRGYSELTAQFQAATADFLGQAKGSMLGGGIG
jgi:hypothetical protein